MKKTPDSVAGLGGWIPTLVLKCIAAKILQKVGDKAK